jgi:hypothetical protein
VRSFEKATVQRNAVGGRAELCAAVRAAAQPTFELARANPVSIKLLGTSARYLFKEGLHETRAVRLEREINRTPKGAFK